MKYNLKDYQKIEEDFEEMIREKMTDKQFWKWVKSWKDVESIIEECLEWDIDDKKEELENFNSNK